MGVFDEVKERVTAREVMERAGIVFNRNNMCRCPFHQDKTASMKVKPTDKKYFCFGCGEKGDAIDFVAKYYNRSPREASELLEAESQRSAEAIRGQNQGEKKAEIEAKKAAIRAEGIAKGVFVPVSSLPQRELQKGAQIA